MGLALRMLNPYASRQWKALSYVQTLEDIRHCYDELFCGIFYGSLYLPTVTM